MNQAKPKAIYILADFAYESIYAEPNRTVIAELLDVSDVHYTAESIRDNLDKLADVEIVLSGWEGPTYDQEFLDAAPNLKAILYGAGSIRRYMTPEFWESGIKITSVAAANAIPVSEFTLSQILFCLKLGWQHANNCTAGHNNRLPLPGAFRSTVGLISMGAIAKLVRKLLESFDINVIAYDPFMSAEAAAEWDIELVSLDKLFARSSVVSLHTPDLPETKGMITGEHFKAMKPYASFINTARSATVRHGELCDVLEQRPDLWAVLDVTEDTSLEEQKRLEAMTNVTLTPHIAGSAGPERARLGSYVIEDIKNYLQGEPLKYQVSEEQFQFMA